MSNFGRSDRMSSCMYHTSVPVEAGKINRCSKVIWETEESRLLSGLFQCVVRQRSVIEPLVGIQFLGHIRKMDALWFR